MGLFDFLEKKRPRVKYRIQVEGDFKGAAFYHTVNKLYLDFDSTVKDKNKIVRLFKSNKPKIEFFGFIIKNKFEFVDVFIQANIGEGYSIWQQVHDEVE